MRKIGKNYRKKNEKIMEIDDNQFGLMPERISTDSTLIFLLRQGERRDIFNIARHN